MDGRGVDCLLIFLNLWLSVLTRTTATPCSFSSPFLSGGFLERSSDRLKKSSDLLGRPAAVSDFCRREEELKLRLMVLLNLDADRIIDKVGLSESAAFCCSRSELYVRAAMES